MINYITQPPQETLILLGLFSSEIKREKYLKNMFTNNCIILSANNLQSVFQSMILTTENSIHWIIVFLLLWLNPLGINNFSTLVSWLRWIFSSSLFVTRGRDAQFSNHDISIDRMLSLLQYVHKDLSVNVEVRTGRSIFTVILLQWVIQLLAVSYLRIFWRLLHYIFWEV